MLLERPIEWPMQLPKCNLQKARRNHAKPQDSIERLDRRDETVDE